MFFKFFMKNNIDGKNNSCSRATKISVEVLEERTLLSADGLSMNCLVPIEDSSAGVYASTRNDIDIIQINSEELEDFEPIVNNNAEEYWQDFTNNNLIEDESTETFIEEPEEMITDWNFALMEEEALENSANSGASICDSSGGGSSGGNSSGGDTDSNKIFVSLSGGALEYSNNYLVTEGSNIVICFTGA